MIGPTYPYRGGISHFTTSLSEAMIYDGHEVQVISFSRQYPLFLYPGKSDRDESQPKPSFKPFYLLDPINPFSWQKTARQIVLFSPDLVVIHWWVTFWAPAFGVLIKLLKRRGIKVVMLIHNVIPHESHWWDRWLTHFALRSASAYLVQTETQKERLIRILPTSHITVFPHPVYDRFSENRMTSEQARKALNLPMDSKIILFFGIVRPYKGLKYLVDAAGLLQQNEIPLYLVIAGEFWEDVEIYREQIHTWGLDKRVTIMDHYIPDDVVSMLFSAADVFVAPYIGGTQSGAERIAESFALPVIVTDALKDGSYSSDVMIVPKADSTRLANAIREVIMTTPNTPKLSVENEDRPTWQEMARTLVAFSSHCDN